VAGGEQMEEPKGLKNETVVVATILLEIGHAFFRLHMECSVVLCCVVKTEKMAVV